MAKASSKTSTVDTTPHRVPHATLEKLEQHVSVVAAQLQRQNSLWLSFVRGVLTGLGASVGVTVVLALVIFLITQIARWFGLESAAQQVVETLQ